MLFGVLGLALGVLGIVAAGTKNPDTTETRLRKLEDREAIRRLLVDYGKLLDQRNFDAFSQLFAEKEGEWVGGMGKAKGPQAIRKLMEDSIGTKPNNSNFHVFTNEIIDLDGDRATATTKWMFMVRGDGNRPQPFYLGHYEDTFIRENGKWKFLRRVAHTDIPAE
jgi:hypothetical protein